MMAFVSDEAQFAVINLTWRPAPLQRVEGFPLARCAAKRCGLSCSSRAFRRR